MSLHVALIDYGSGNLRSAGRALERVAGEVDPAARVTLTRDPAVVRAATHIVLPGVGAFADCRAGLTAIPHMIQTLTETVHGQGRPFLGICVGMQLLATEGREYGTTPGLNWIPGAVTPIAPADPTLKVPHMGWNALRVAEGQENHPLLAGLPATPYVYFVHSYHLVCDHPGAHRLATTDHGGPLTAMVCRDTVAGTQFHPEKSQAVGLRFLRNFLEWRP